MALGVSSRLVGGIDTQRIPDQEADQEAGLGLQSVQEGFLERRFVATVRYATGKPAEMQLVAGKCSERVPLPGRRSRLER